MRAVLIVTSTLLWAWGGIWILLFPALLLSDADNGRFAHDLRLVWLPEVALAVTGAVACLVFIRYESNQPPLWRVLAVPVAAVTAIAALSTVVFSSAGP